MAANSCVILLVEEEPILRDVTGFRLELLGYEVVTCEGANQAQGWLQQNLPRLSVLGLVAERGSLDLRMQLIE